MPSPAPIILFLETGEGMTRHGFLGAGALTAPANYICSCKKPRRVPLPPLLIDFYPLLKTVLVVVLLNQDTWKNCSQLRLNGSLMQHHCVASYRGCKWYPCPVFQKLFPLDFVYWYQLVLQLNKPWADCALGCIVITTAPCILSFTDVCLILHESLVIISSLDPSWGGPSLILLTWHAWLSARCPF